MRKITTLLSVLVVLALVYGCSSKPRCNFKLSQRLVTIHTEPEGAQVIQLRPLNQASMDLGVTPLENRPVMVLTTITMKNMPFHDGQELMNHGNNLVILIQKEGYEPHRATIAMKADESTEYTAKLTPKSN